MTSYVLLIAYLEELFDDRVDDTTPDVEPLKALWAVGDKRVGAYEFKMPNTADREDALLVGLGHAFKGCWNPGESVYALVEVTHD